MHIFFEFFEFFEFKKFKKKSEYIFFFDREIRRQVGNRQGDKYGNQWEARRILRHRATTKSHEEYPVPRSTQEEEQ